MQPAKRTQQTVAVAAVLRSCRRKVRQSSNSHLPVAKKPALEEVPEIVEAMQESEKILGEEGRLLVRYSGTENKLRVLVEAKDGALAKQECERIAQAARTTIGE